VGNGSCRKSATFYCLNGREPIGESCYDVKSPSGTSSSGSSSDNNSSGSNSGNNSEPAVQGSSGPTDYSWLACKVACEKYADSDSQKTCAKSCFASCSPQTDKIKAAQCAKGESTSSNSTSSNSTPAAGSISGSYQGEYGYYSGSTTTSSGEIKLPSKIDILNSKKKKVTNKSIKGNLCIINTFYINGANNKQIKAEYDRTKIKISRDKKNLSRLIIRRVNDNLTSGDKIKVELTRKSDKKTAKVVLTNNTNCSQYNITNATSTSVRTQYYTGQTITPKPVLTLKINGKNVKLNNYKDVTITYKNNINVGQGVIVYTGKGIYTGKKEVTFNIVNGNTSNTLEIQNPSRSLTDNKCDDSAVTFNVVETSGEEIKSATYVNTNHAFKALTNNNLSCNGNTCKVTIKSSQKNMYLQVSTTSGKTKTFGPFNICINTMKIDDTKIKSGKCVSKSVSTTITDVNETKIKKVEYKNSNHDWKKLSSSNLKISNNKAIIKIKNSHKNLYIRVTNEYNFVQTFGPYNVCVK